MFQVGRARAQRLHVWLVEVAVPHPAVRLERLRRGDQHRAARLEIVVARLDVHELLEAQVGAKARLGEHVVGVAESEAVTDDRAAAVGDVAERPGVDNHRLALGGLHQVGLDGVAQQRHHRPDRVDLLRRYGPAAVREADYDP